MAASFTSRSIRSSSVVVGLCCCGFLITLVSYLVHLHTAQESLSDHAGTALAAAVLEILSLVVVVVLVVLAALKPPALSQTGALRWTRLVITSVTFFLGSVVAVVAITQAFSASRDLDAVSQRLDALSTSSGICYAMWAMSLLFELALTLLCFLPHKKPSPIEPEDGSVDHSFTTMTSTTETKKSTSLEMGNLKPSSFPSPPAAAARRSIVSTTSSKKSSFRRSVQQMLHPQNSRTRLMHQPSFQSMTETIPPCPSTQHQPDPFDTWEVDTHDPQRLEPIPGSRPVSPAKALDGPFPHDDNDTEYTSFPDPSLPSPTLHTFHNAGVSRSRSGSATSEGHIHPLFRSDSPLPPPLASPGTIVTASQWGGHIVSTTDRDRAMSLSRTVSRSSSRPASPGLPMSSWIKPSSRVCSRAGSVSSSVAGGRVPLRSVRSDERMVEGRGVLRRQQSFYT
ncbi:hypothetical protein MBLNU457_7120t1 [Dothideomycetes sp. NU457]